MGTTSQQFCLKWNNHSSNMLNVFETLLTSEQLVDVTLACDGLSLKAHKMVLSACSPFFQSLFQENPCKHPIVILKDIRYADLKAIIDFMYKGEVNVGQAHLSALLKTAETLKVKGLAEVSGEDGQSSSGSVVQQEVPVYPQAQHSSDVANIVQTIDSSVRPSSDSPTGRKRKRTKWKNRGGQSGGGNDSETDDQGPAAKNQEIVSADVIEDDSSSIGVVDGPSDTRNAKDSRIIIEEATIVGDYVEPAALMEQNMTTDNVQPVSSQLMLTNATSKDNNINVPESRSYDTTVATMNPETVDLVDRPEDVKPTALVSYEEPPMSPNATSSHHSQDDSNSMTMYMDPNSMPAIAGPSNYQQDKQPSASAGQEGVDFPKLTSENNIEANANNNLIILPKPFAKTILHKCGSCLLYFTEKKYLLNHIRDEHNVPRIINPKMHECFVCDVKFMTKSNLNKHLEYHKLQNEKQSYSDDKNKEQKKDDLNEFFSMEIPVVKYNGASKPLSILEPEYSNTENPVEIQTNKNEDFSNSASKLLSECSNNQNSMEIPAVKHKGASKSHSILESEYSNTENPVEIQTNKNEEFSKPASELLSECSNNESSMEFPATSKPISILKPEYSNIEQHPPSFQSRRRKAIVYKCGHCEATFSVRYRRDNHERYKHISYECEICNAKFFEKTFYDKHVEYHKLETERLYGTKNNPQKEDDLARFSCSFCKEKFHWKDQQVVHERTCHQDNIFDLSEYSAIESSMEMLTNKNEDFSKPASKLLTECSNTESSMVKKSVKKKDVSKSVSEFKLKVPVIKLFRVKVPHETMILKSPIKDGNIET